MSKKKLKTKLAKEIRNRYGLEFIPSIKIAKAIIQNNFANVVLDLGFRSERETYPTCGRECCYEYGDSFFYGRNKRDEYIEFKSKDLKRIKNDFVIDEPRGGTNMNVSEKVFEYERMIKTTLFVLKELSKSSDRKSQNKHFPQHQKFYEGRANGLQDAYEQLKMELENLHLLFDHLEK